MVPFASGIFVLNLTNDQFTNFKVTLTCSIVKWSHPFVVFRIFVLNITNNWFADFQETKWCSKVKRCDSITCQRIFVLHFFKNVFKYVLVSFLLELPLCLPFSKLMPLALWPTCQAKLVLTFSENQKKDDLSRSTHTYKCDILTTFLC